MNNTWTIHVLILNKRNKWNSTGQFMILSNLPFEDGNAKDLLVVGLSLDPLPARCHFWNSLKVAIHRWFCMWIYEIFLEVVVVSQKGSKLELWDGWEMRNERWESRCSLQIWRIVYRQAWIFLDLFVFRSGSSLGQNYWLIDDWWLQNCITYNKYFTCRLIDWWPDARCSPWTPPVGNSD